MGEFTLRVVYTGESSHRGKLTLGRVHSGGVHTGESSHWGELTQGTGSQWEQFTHNRTWKSQSLGTDLGYKCDRQNHEELAEQEKHHTWPLRPIVVAAPRRKYPKIDGLIKPRFKKQKTF